MRFAGAIRPATDFYPRPPRGGRRLAVGGFRFQDDISIHALREEGDQGSFNAQPTAPRFLSTPSARRATKSLSPPPPLPNNFYPRPPRGGRPGRWAGRLLQSQFLSTPSARRATFPGYVQAARGRYFYPRPPRGGRLQTDKSTRSSARFLSTPSARRATWQGGCDYDLQLISIHALREEGDLCHDLFSSMVSISIHALREEGDSKNRDKISIFL